MAPVAPARAEGRAISDAVVAWWASSAVRRERDRLAWRARRDPWRVLVSEVMLAQTQIGRVQAHFEPFLARFPSPSSLASAPLAEVLACWSGLGYPRRAVALQRAASVLVDEHAGRVPSSYRELRDLAGVGDYTARAVMAFAFDAPVMPVDTNIARVLARAVAGQPLGRARSQEVADSLVAGARRGRRRSQAVMDLGATVCRPSPSCDRCPLGPGSGQPTCAWRGGEEPDPAEGTFGSSRRQAPFEGSDRQGRGRLLRAAAARTLVPAELALAAGWPGDPTRAERVARTLVADGLLERGPEGGYRLPC